jgi:allantoate deiminase
MTSLEAAREAIQWCRTIAECSETPGAITRTFLSKPMHGVHAHLGSWMLRSGMTVHVDAVGNIRGLYPAAPAAPDSPRLLIGSHLDTVPNGGAYDGVLGVAIAVALVQQLKGHRFPFGIEVIGFSDEEGIRFDLPFIGSRAVAGTFDAAWLDRCDRNGIAMREAITTFGLDPSRVADARAGSNAIGYLELHIEQGPTLERLNFPLAVVDAVVGQSRVNIVFTGAAGHAGTTPMRDRRDALACAVHWMSEVERECGATDGLVATVGQIAVRPGAGNVIPGRCEVSLDVRHADDAVRCAALERLEQRAREIAAARRIDVTWEPRFDQDSVPLDQAMRLRLARALEQAGFPAHTMSSGAGHDAAMMASALPTGMIFLRCEQGISHHPAESVREDDVAAALEAGRQFLDDLAAAMADASRA